MQLHSLTLHGFKSFGDRIRIEFSSGVTGIIGPNGSGKSNIIDGLKWATGGGRANQFRAGDKTDLIFHGADAKRSVSHAEVEIELQNGRERIKVNRSLFRDGSTTLKLNGKNSRLIDVEEQLAGTGLGKSGLAIVGQGEIGQVLMADPEKLLNYVAEAADVARLSSRREQSQGRLEAALVNLQRLEDIMLELESQLELLREEASLAEKHNFLSRESLILRYSLSVHRENGLKKELRTLSEQDQKLTGELEDIRVERSQTQENWQAARRKTTELETFYREALTKAEAQKGEVRVAEERLNALTQQETALEREKTGLQSEIAFIKESEAPLAPQDDLKSLEDAQLRQEGAVTQLNETISTYEAERTEVQQTLNPLRQKVLQESQAALTYESKKERLEQHLNTLKLRLESVSALDTNESEDIAGQVEKLELSYTKAQEELEQLKAELSTALQDHARLHAESSALARSAEQSRNAFEARRGYATGPKLALNSGIDGVLGSVADILSIPKKYRRALASALGRRAEYIITDTSDTAQKVIAFVKEKGGWVTTLPLDLVKARQARLDSKIAAQAGIIGLAIDLVDVDKRFETIVLQLLGNTTLAETMPEAVRVAKQFQTRPRLVTLEGGVLESYGAMSGGQSKTSVSVLGAAKDVEDLEEQAEQALALSTKQQNHVAKLQATLKDKHARLQDTERLFKEQRSKLSKTQEARSVQSSLKQELEQQYSIASQELSSLSKPEESNHAQDLEQLETKLQSLNESLENQKTERAKQLELYRDLKQQLSLVQERQSTYQRSLSAFNTNQERLEQLNPKLEFIMQNEAKLKAQLSEAKDVLNKAEAALPKDVAEHQKAYAESLTHTEVLENKLTELTETQAETAAKLESIKLSLARREAAFELAQEERKSFPEGLEPNDMSARSCRERLAQVELELEGIGPVNHRAAQDLEQQKERFDDLQVQSVQATLAVTELEAVLSKIDTEVSSKLKTAVASLKFHFQQYVKDLFGDNAKSDIIVHSEDDRPTGLSIILQPPGKQTQSLNLLSVGERTMGAMAFLFSLLHGQENQRLPIAILDEVDAPLDEANIRRYCSFLDQIAKKGTQFVLITHQKATFEVADVLWGITSDRGVSRVFSISKQEYDVA